MGTDNIVKKKMLANKKAKEERKLLSRSAGNRSLIPKILILTEGLSEEIYFQNLIVDLSLNTVTVKKSTNTDSIGIVNEAIQLAKQKARVQDEYTFVFCVFDLDTVKNKNFIDLIKGFKSKNTVIFPIYSYPCIEVFFCLHYELITRPFSATGNKSIGDNVKDYFKNKFDEVYHETNEESIADLTSKYRTAIYNSQKLIETQTNFDSINPISTVYKVIILLDSISRRSNSYNFKNDDIEKFIESKI